MYLREHLAKHRQGCFRCPPPEMPKLNSPQEYQARSKAQGGWKWKEFKGR